MKQARRFILISEMNELEENWADFIREANLRSRGTNSGVADYLRLRETNDAARRIGIEWLLGAFLQVAEEANRRRFGITIEKKEPHSFPVDTATMQGSLVRLKLGVRSITVEAGYPQRPQDGFIRGGGLACARISHFGLAKANQDLMLVRSEQTAPVWCLVGDSNSLQQFHIPQLKHHFETFVGKI
ncbi:MAG: hypothetical protein M3209_19665 [Acidobacteriota bacterium]|nr:hypothetical protein [Acidobacteriota bacterium]